MHFPAKILPNNRFLSTSKGLASPLWEILDPPLTRAVLITVRNEVEKVMFLHMCVCPQRREYLGRCPPDQVHPPGTRYIPGTRYTPRPGTPPGTPPRTRYTLRGQGTPPRPGTRYTPTGPGTTPQDQVHPLGPGTPPSGDGYCCGWYASYWNAFLW